VLAETLAVELEEPAAVLVLLVGHAHEDAGRRRICLAQALCELAVDAAVLFLILDGEGQHLAIGQIGKGALRRERQERHGGPPVNWNNSKVGRPHPQATRLRGWQSPAA
jgi:hypothetical protein